jgi:thioredoxin-dependent peroxiredoxin
MPPTKKQSTEPTRRSTRVVSQSSTTSATAAPKPAKAAAAPKPAPKRAAEKPAASEPESVKKAKKGLVVGDKLPDITLQDETGSDVKIVDITFEKGIILFAYPRASTPGCTKQVYFSIASVNIGLWIS